MTQYLLAVYPNVDQMAALTPEDMQKIFDDVDRYNQDLQTAGAWVFAGGLHPADSATVVEATEQGVTMTDGPYAEAKEHIGGFWIIEAADLDQALDWASKGSAACVGKVEVRPFQDQ
jgi:hypothetical protein